MKNRTINIGVVAEVARTLHVRPIMLEERMPIVIVKINKILEIS
ncbi:MAG: hypothetical protein ACLFT4_07660 [Bacteroidales bacterium]